MQSLYRWGGWPGSYLREIFRCTILPVAADIVGCIQTEPLRPWSQPPSVRIQRVFFGLSKHCSSFHALAMDVCAWCAMICAKGGGGVGGGGIGRLLLNR